ncbi:MAG: trehalose-phosphatase [Gammaproteobacteria bacterium]
MVGEAKDWALFLDFDGTLVDLAPTPEGIIVPRELPALLQGLAAYFKGALAVVTGRSLSNLDRHLGLSLPAAGQHGAQWRLRPNQSLREQFVPALEAVRGRVEELAGVWPDLVVEDKGSTLAVHYRAVPEAGEQVNALLAELARASSGTLEVIMGKSVCEVRPAGVDKGAALEAFLHTSPFTGRRPLMLGDDVTDEAGFATALRCGGAAIKVGVGESCAPWRLPAPDAVRAWLSMALEASDE